MSRESLPLPLHLEGSTARLTQCTSSSFSAVMAVLTSALLFSYVWVVCSASSGIHIKETEPGKDVVLNCRGSSSNINLVIWNRADLGEHQYVFYRNGNTSISKQLQSYQDRVSLQDPQMKNGNVSVVLKNVTISDNGTYECLVREKNTGRRKRSAEIYEPQSRTKIQLLVRPADSVSGDHPQTGSAGPTDGGSSEAGSSRGHTLSVVTFVMVVTVMFIVCGVVWKRSQRTTSDQSAA